MEVIQNVVNTEASTSLNFTNVVSGFDLENENINSFFPNLTLLSMLLTSVAGNVKPITVKQTFKEEYDYIIVGGGSAGSVMANRLSEIPCISVLLLEAGGVPPLLTEVPSFAGIFYNSAIDWGYRTIPQKYSAFAHKENRVPWNSGKVLGGGSTLNAMLYVRGNMKNFDDWEADGAIGWAYEDVFPYFLKLEDNRNIHELDPGYHRKRGPQTAEKSNYIPEIKHPLLEAAISMGYELRDINGRRQTGFYDLQATIRNQQRCSTAKAYLEPAKDRPNLDILTNAFVRKVLISKKHGINAANGVEFDHLGKTWTVKAKREVILSNGAIRTPQLLMLSGIGPKEHLKKFKIPVVADLPVGKNLQDHYATNLIYTVNKTIPTIAEKNLDPVNILDYIANRKGKSIVLNNESEKYFRTLTTGITLVAFLNGLHTNKYSRDFPRQELYFAEYNTLAIQIQSNLKDEVFKRVYEPYALQPVYVCFSSLLQPYTRGEILLNSTDPYDWPLINPRYYEDPRDLRDVVEGMKICDAIAKHPAMRQVQAQLIETQRTGFPGCEKFEKDQDMYFGCMAKHVVNTFWHFSGTARMGHPYDPRSVVDPELRVIGVKNLRVVNAAVMPKVTSGNTNVPVIMIAEKAYGMMKPDIKCGYDHSEHEMYQQMDQEIEHENNKVLELIEILRSVSIEILRSISSKFSSYF